jgi:hypothetical protein
MRILQMLRLMFGRPLDNPESLITEQAIAYAVMG